MEKTILIVDDSESIREVVSFTLENAGYKVLIGTDGVDALQFLNGNHIDLVLTDFHMPNMDGISLIKEIRAKANYQYTPILLLTTESQAAKKEEAKAAGATGWIVKPFVQDKLLAVVQKLIRS
jgi:two-component system chemotaxis response regulator CheY